jgi:carbamoyltransferase
MATTLGLSFFFHDSAAAIVRDGQVVAAAAEERFCRRKHTNEFPKRAIEYCLEAAGLDSISELNAIVFYEKPLTKFLRVIETLVQTWPLSIGIFTRRLPNFLAAKFNVYRVIERELPGYQGEVFFAEHHLSHAASAFYCSPFERAAILTTDGVGEWETTTLGVGEGREIKLDCAIHFPHSIGLLYSALTSYLGFQVNDGEWKVMGLAPYGEPKYVEPFRQLVQLKPDGSFRLNMKYFVHHYSSHWTAHERRWQDLFGIPRRQPKSPIEQQHEDLARSGQVVVEELILALAREARRRTGSNNLVIAGGVGLNSVANWKIEKEGVFENVWIQPAAGDDGGALGAALLVSQHVFNDPPTAEMKHAYLGPEFSDDETRGFLEMKGIPGERLTDTELVERVADAIAQGSVVGWCRGRMELGPRALGARSILADATNPEMKTIINKKIKYREYFRPFAPAVPLEDVHKYFEVEPGTEMPFMLKVPPVRAEARSKIPAVTHEDGSGRVQTVTEAINPLYYRTLKALVPRVGVSVVLNTSFNVRGEPIVCTPEDAYNCFINTGIDMLVLSNYLITQKPVAEVDTEAGYKRSDAMEKRLGVEAPEPAVVRGSILDTGTTAELDTAEKVLAFYKELPFNYYSNAIDTSVELLRENRIREYPNLDRYLSQRQGLRVLDLGCGAGWFANSCAHYYGHDTVGLDVNPVALRQARAVARLLPSGAKVEFVCSDLFAYEPGEPFDVVNSLGVLHHTPDCHAAIQKALTWIAPGGYLHLGLYHLYGRQPFLDHFARLKNGYASFGQLYGEFERLNPDITDRTHLLSWFRDQVLHPHETQHTYEELHELLTAEGFTIESTSINNFGKLAPLPEMIAAEKECAAASEKALRQGRYYPGFFVVWARKLDGTPIAAKSHKESRSHARSETGIAG